MLRITYRSKAANGTDFQMARQIAGVARGRNRSLEITGVLLFCGDTFVQVIEGGTNVLEALYLKICQDSRHTNVELLSKEVITQRVFPYASLQFAEIEPGRFEQPQWQDAFSEKGAPPIEEICKLLSYEYARSRNLLLHQPPGTKASIDCFAGF